MRMSVEGIVGFDRSQFTEKKTEIINPWGVRRSPQPLLNDAPGHKILSQKTRLSCRPSSPRWWFVILACTVFIRQRHWLLSSQIWSGNRAQVPPHFRVRAPLLRAPFFLCLISMAPSAHFLRLSLYSAVSASLCLNLWASYHLSRSLVCKSRSLFWLSEKSELDFAPATVLIWWSP